MYRPTVRYSDYYRNYINEVFRVTTLDRNQILRLALHTSAHSDNFKSILSKYKRGDVPLPQPNWVMDDMGLWLENVLIIEERGEYVNVKHESKNEGTFERREREISTRIKNQGGIKITIG